MGNRRGTVSKKSKDNQPDSSDDDESQKKKTGDPLVSVGYDFLIEPDSSRAAGICALITCFFLICYFGILWLESLNGPNQFTDRVDRSTVSFLFTERQYLYLKLGCITPMVFDALLKIALMYMLLTKKANRRLRDILLKNEENFYNRYLILGDIIGSIPFFIFIGIILPLKMSLDDFPEIVRALYRTFEIVNCCRILRVTKDVPAIKAIRIALSKSAKNILLPVFFFALFNVSAGVIMFFIEPCFSDSSCPWHDLFEASYFTVVSMTTVGYGDQYPEYDFGRFIALIVCFFGVLFVAMPLAIIGNEYEDAWGEVTHQLLEAKRERVEKKKETDQMMRVYRDKLTNLRKSDDKTKEKPSALQKLKAGTRAIGGLELRKASSRANGTMLFSQGSTLATLVKEHDILTHCKQMPLLASFFQVMRVTSALQKEMSLNPSEMFINPSILLGLAKARDCILNLAYQMDSCLDRIQSNMSDEAFNSGIQKQREEFGLGQEEAKKTRTRRNSAVSISVPPLENMRRLDKLTAGGAEHHSAVLPGPRYGVASVAKENNLRSWVKTGRQSSVFTSSQGFLTEEMKTKERKKQLIQKMNEDIAARLESEEAVYRHIPIVTPILQWAHRMLIDFGVLSEPVAPEPDDAVGDKKKKKMQRKKESDKKKSKLPLHERILLERLEEVKKNPESLNNRIWVLLEIPGSSKEARAVRLGILSAIIFSVFVLYTETLTTFTDYGEGTHHCESVLEIYCADKTVTSDPGCFVQDVNTGGPSEIPLKFRCDTDECFGQAQNFGVEPGYTNMTCSESSSLQAFQSSDELVGTYGRTSVFINRYDMQYRANICDRIECRLNGAAMFDAKVYWIYAEFIINTLFTIELAARVLSAGSIYHYFYDMMNLLDLLVIVPYYVDLVRADFYGVRFMEMDFSILASSPQPLIFVVLRTMKILRLFKLSRHFKESRVLLETAANAWRQILGVIILLVWLTFIFSVMLFEVEAGVPCYVGENGCELKPDAQLIYKEGDRVVLDKYGNISQYPDVFVCVWFCFVTLTTVGYGDIGPITNAGMVSAIFLMLAGSMYMSIPLTVAGNEYYTVHEKYMSRADIEMAHRRKEIAQQVAAASAAIEESLKATESGRVGADEGAITEEKEKKKDEVRLDYHMALACKSIQFKFIEIRNSLHEITNELLEPIHGVMKAQRDAQMVEVLKETTKKLHDHVFKSQSCMIRLAETVFKRKKQLAELVEKRKSMMKKPDAKPKM